MRRLALVIALISTLLPCGPRSGHACGPFIPYAVFVSEQHPDSLAAFAAGRLGILEPSYARSYLCLAYRMLAGVPLDVSEQKAALALWERRLSGWEPDDTTGVHAWLMARSQVPGIPSLLGPAVLQDLRYRSEGYGAYLACPDGAYATAAATLRERAGRLGWDSPAVRDWVHAQDEVFAACAHPTSLPDAVPATAEARADRAYQEAALSFYLNRYEDAERRFDAIAADRSSPWRVLAPYLAARAEVRRATLEAPEGQADSAGLARADARIERILADPSLKDVHATALELRGFVRFRLAPVARLKVLSATLMMPHSGATLENDLDDLTLLLDRVPGVREVDDDEGHAPGAGADQRLAADDLVDWVTTFQGEEAQGAHALERWRATRSLPWLVAALAVLPAGASVADTLLEAARVVPEDSPAHLTVALHQARLLAGADRSDRARAVLDAALHAPALGISARNRLLAARLALARDFTEWRHLAARAPASVWIGPEQEVFRYPADFPTDSTTGALVHEISGRPVCFDEDATVVFDRGLPLTRWFEAARDAAMPARLRGELALAGFARAVAIGREAVAREPAALVAELRPDCADDARAFLAAAPGEERSFAATLLLLRTPGARPHLVPGVSRTTPARRIDDYQDNWWCARPSGEGWRMNVRDPLGDHMPWIAPQDTVALSRAREPKPLAAPAFLSLAERAEAEREVDALRDLDGAADWLPARALAYAKSHPQDPRVPEALHLAVRATRYGCGSDRTSALSREAFMLLHRRYPASEWTKRTRFWF